MPETTLVASLLGGPHDGGLVRLPAGMPPARILCDLQPSNRGWYMPGVIVSRAEVRPHEHEVTEAMLLTPCGVQPISKRHTVYVLAGNRYRFAGWRSEGGNR